MSGSCFVAFWAWDLGFSLPNLGFGGCRFRI